MLDSFTMSDIWLELECTFKADNKNHSFFSYFEVIHEHYTELSQAWATGPALLIGTLFLLLQPSAL